jgi:hypothetical protein
MDRKRPRPKIKKGCKKAQAQTRIGQNKYKDLEKRLELLGLAHVEH